jgi:hypothetical protein
VVQLDPRQREAVGTAAIFVAAGLLALIATGLARFGINAMRAVDELGGDPRGGGGLPVMVLVLAGFLYLTAFAFVLLPLAARRKSGAANPGFAFVSAVFDGFWRFVSGIFGGP